MACYLLNVVLDRYNNDFEETSPMEQKRDTRVLETEFSDTCFKNLKIAVIHDWLITYGGAERVLEQILQVFPQADLFALCDFTPENERGYFLNKPVSTSFLQKFPFARQKYRSYLPLMPMAIEQFDLSEYDLIISSSHAVAHGVLTNSEQLHISYINNTMVYAWDLYHHYLDGAGLKRGLSGIVARMIMHYIRNWDSASAGRVDQYLANSSYMAGRIKKLYNKQAEVIYPPVEVEKFEISSQREDYYVTVARLVPFKRIDLIVEAFNKTPDRRLIVIGDGPDRKTLERSAGSNIEFPGFQNQKFVNKYIKRARAFLFSSVEPFGIAVVEALACGTPVIAYDRGAAPEIVCDGENGILFDKQDADGMIAAVERFEKREASFDPVQIRSGAFRFSSREFRKQFRNYVARAIRQKFHNRFSNQTHDTDIDDFPIKTVTVPGVETIEVVR